MQVPSLTSHIVIVLLFGAISVCNAQQQKYDYRDSAQYRGLNADDRAKLDQFATDMVSLETAIKKHMRDRNGQAPETLEALVPKYLLQLPRDPFHTPVSQPNKYHKHYQESLSGSGYLYMRRRASSIVKSWEPLTFHSTEDSWRIKSVGLPDFPLRSPVESKNRRGLVRSAGYWGRFILDVF